MYHVEEGVSSFVFGFPNALRLDRRFFSSSFSFFVGYSIRFVGLELIAVELDDPFGNDENDFE